MLAEERALRVAICGTRGIPASYGGFETLAEELSSRLVVLGFDVTVYARRHVIAYHEPFYRGVRIRKLWAPRHKYFETPVHSLLSFLDVVRDGTDVAIVCNAANSPFIWILRFFGIPVAVNVDGVERLRSKWNWVGRLWYLLGERCSVWFASQIIADAQVIADYYKNTYGAETVVIAYGVHPESVRRGKRKAGVVALGDAEPHRWLDSERALFEELRVAPGRYILYVSRLEPENNAHTVIKAFEQLPAGLREEYPLVIVGDAPYAKSYIARLRAMAGSEVRFCGYRFGAQYVTLQDGARVYIQATEVGGTHPALVEAMGFANAIIANQTPENLEVLGDTGLFYRRNDVNDLARLLRELLTNEALLAYLRREAFLRAHRRYSWEWITEDYAALLRRIVANRSERSAQNAAT